MMPRNEMQMRSLETRYATAGDFPLIEGYFAVFGSETELWRGIFEEIAPGAFTETLGGDVRALINHDTGMVLGRTTANTLELREDEKGLFGRIHVNEKDTDAMNLYERVKRGDVTQCSFGFEILEEDSEFRDDGTAKFTVKKVRLHEVSVCTFPAYEDTGVEARSAQVENHKKLQIAERKTNIKKEILKDVKKDEIRSRFEG